MTSWRGVVAWSSDGGCPGLAGTAGVSRIVGCGVGSGGGGGGDPGISPIKSFLLLINTGDSEKRSGCLLSIHSENRRMCQSYKRMQLLIKGQMLRNH